MIIYIFNNYFPDNSGFGKRCMKEIEILAKQDSVFVICRRNNKKNNKKLKIGEKMVTIESFGGKFTLIERTKAYKTGYYEILRNIDLLKELNITLLKTLWKYRKEKNMKIYVVNSPLTVPAIVYVLTKIFNRTPDILEFHDLEPELAKDIKKIDDTNLVMKITYFLERFLCRKYKKIITTSRSQANILLKRTNITQKKILVIPNSINIIQQSHTLSKREIYHKYNITKNDFILTYASNLSYDYTIEGMKQLLQQMPKLLKKIPLLKIIILGDGEGKKFLEKIVETKKLNKHVVFTGKIAHVKSIIELADIGIIPWIKTDMTKTILPTKLFDYMRAKRAIIAPSFGEFDVVLKNNQNAILYTDIDELIRSIVTLYKNQNLRKTLQKNSYQTYIKKYHPKKYDNVLRSILC